MTTNLNNDTFKEKVYFNYNKARSISEYGRTNKSEYFAEWFSHYRMRGAKGVPEDLLTIFKSIE